MLIHFETFEQQDHCDLESGQQLEACQRVAKRDTGFQDHSIDGAWTPDED
jgi:cold shock CspA family protein